MTYFLKKMLKFNAVLELQNYIGGV